MDYDIVLALDAIEKELIESMMKNMRNHRATEDAESYHWKQWQAEQLKALERYKRDNQKRYGVQFQRINNQIEDMIRTARQVGRTQQEIRILQAIRKGYKVHGGNASPSPDSLTGEFFKVNDRKLNALITATMADVEKAETAILRRANDQYRKTIFNAQVYANTGAGTYEGAVDMAAKDMLAAGLNCVEYANGSRHTLKDYADMAIRTASKRAYLTGEGETRQRWGISLVIVNKRGNPCPKCLPYVGLVMIDDVWSGGSPNDGDYPLMSAAVSHGLYHPRCKDNHTTYFDGVSDPPDGVYTRKELDDIIRNYENEQKQRYISRQAEKYKRMSDNFLDLENKKKYEKLAEQWNNLKVSRKELHQKETKLEKLKKRQEKSLAETAQSRKELINMYAQKYAQEKVLKVLKETGATITEEMITEEMITEATIAADEFISNVRRKIREKRARR